MINLTSALAVHECREEFTANKVLNVTNQYFSYMYVSTKLFTIKRMSQTSACIVLVNERKSIAARTAEFGASTPREIVAAPFDVFLFFFGGEVTTDVESPSLMLALAGPLCFIMPFPRLRLAESVDCGRGTGVTITWWTTASLASCTLVGDCLTDWLRTTVKCSLECMS